MRSDSNETLSAERDFGMEDIIFISGLLVLCVSSCICFFGGGVGSSSSEEELELDDFSSSSESNVVCRSYYQSRKTLRVPIS